MKPLEKIVLVAGFILAFAAGLSLLYCIVPVTAGSEFTLEIPATEAQRFFRLKTH